VLISHDRRLLERISRTTIWLDYGITRTLNEGFKAFEPWRDDILEQEASEGHKLGRKIAMDAALPMAGARGRSTVSEIRISRWAVRRSDGTHRHQA